MGNHESVRRSVVYMLKIVCLLFFSLVRDGNGDDACPRRILNIGLFSYRYGGHIELVRFKEYYGMAGGHKHILIYSLSINVRLSGHFFLTFSLNKIVMGKKDRRAVFGCKDDHLFPEKRTLLYYYMQNVCNLIGSEYVIFGIHTTSDISKLSQISLAQRLVKLRITISKYHSCYL